MSPTRSLLSHSLVFIVFVFRLVLVGSLGVEVVRGAPGLSLGSARARAVGGNGLEDRIGLGLNQDDGVDVERYPFLKTYSDFQISDGFGGLAEEEAAEVFIRPFNGIDLSTITYELFDKLKLAKEATEDAEIEWFEPGISRAGEDTPTGQAMKVGLLKNRVLFATAAVQILEIEAAHNKALKVVDPYEQDDLSFARSYLAWTIEADQENDGEPSLGVT